MIERMFKSDYYEELFGKAVRENFNRDLEKAANGEPIEHSKRHIAKMEKLLAESEKNTGKKAANIITIERADRESRPSFVKNTAKWAVRIAASFVLMFAVAAGYFLSVPAVREAVIGVVTGETTATGTAVTTDPETAEAEVPYEIPVTTNNIPYNAETGKPLFVEELEKIDIHGMYYFDANGKIIDAKYMIDIRQIGGSISSDENSFGYQSVENGITYYVYESLIEDRPSLVTWKHGEAEMWIFGMESATDLLNTAKATEKNK
jgi:hypothetical protein